MTLSVIPHTVRSFFVNTSRALAVAAEAVWYADVRLGRAAGAVVAVDDDAEWSGIDAVAMDSLDRTRSRGYVVPAKGAQSTTRHYSERVEAERTD